MSALLQSIGLDQREFWTAVISLCVVGLLFFGRDVLDEAAAADDARAWRVGDKPRRPRAPATWARHELLGAATALGVAVALRAMI